MVRGNKESVHDEIVHISNLIETFTEAQEKQNSEYFGKIIDLYVEEKVHLVNLYLEL